MKLPELKQILKENKIRGYSTCTRPEVIVALEKHNLLPEMIPPDHKQLKTIRTNPKKVEITDLTTNDVMVYPSIYEAGKSLSLNPGLIKYHNDGVYKNYAIKIL